MKKHGLIVLFFGLFISFSAYGAQNLPCYSEADVQELGKVVSGWKTAKERELCDSKELKELWGDRMYLGGFEYYRPQSSKYVYQFDGVKVTRINFMAFCSYPVTRSGKVDLSKISDGEVAEFDLVRFFKQTKTDFRHDLRCIDGPITLDKWHIDIQKAIKMESTSDPIMPEQPSNPAPEIKPVAPVTPVPDKPKVTPVDTVGSKKKGVSTTDQNHEGSIDSKKNNLNPESITNIEKPSFIPYKWMLGGGSLVSAGILLHVILKANETKRRKFGKSENKSFSDKFVRYFKRNKALTALCVAGAGVAVVGGMAKLLDGHWDNGAINWLNGR
ncbi:hypothetical protein KAU11_03125 [Candidatus Babeliales bacterium]|nr:hypothetical protein [Candidatus Babeliales bacterium]